MGNTLPVLWDIIRGKTRRDGQGAVQLFKVGLSCLYVALCILCGLISGFFRGAVTAPITRVLSREGSLEVLSRYQPWILAFLELVLSAVWYIFDAIIHANGGRDKEKKKR